LQPSQRRAVAAPPRIERREHDRRSRETPIGVEKSAEFGGAIDVEEMDDVPAALGRAQGRADLGSVAAGAESARQDACLDRVAPGDPAEVQP